MSSPLTLDGRHGGGQILRSALSLAMITGRPFELSAIRAQRPKPGLMRQHLAAVTAAATLCDAVVEGAEPGSSALRFAPGALRSGDFRFAIGSAGSTTLVLQTLLPAMLAAPTGQFCIEVSGGTHNPLAPSADFLQHCFLPLLRRMGACVTLELQRYGFHPAGGGQVRLQVEAGHRLQGLLLEERGALLQTRARALVANLPSAIGKRELQVLSEAVGGLQDHCKVIALSDCNGPGNLVELQVTHAHVEELFCGHGAKSRPAEQVALDALGPMQRYLQSNAAVGEHLADQLMLPLALAGTGRFTTTQLSAHMASNAEVIEAFLPVRFDFSPAPGALRVEVTAGPG
jgi:RNA 3'-terminal phosphate cyclase (ATP)